MSSGYKSIQYYDSATAHLGRTTRAMQTAIRAGKLPKALSQALTNRVTSALAFIDDVAKPAMIGAVVSVKVYRDGNAAPIIERSAFDRATLEAAIKTSNRNYDLSEDGVISDARTGERVGYVEVIATNDDGKPLNVTKRVLDLLADARAAGQSDRGVT